jgi:hypothetical protein
VRNPAVGIACLPRNGYASEMINAEKAAGAQYFRPRRSMIYPMVELDDIEKA